MRSYTNNSGEMVEVNDFHLDTAIKIKEELQKLSPSGKVSWVKHKKMMEIEGYYDSESNSENYRCMIKAEQKSRGILPSAITHAELVADKTLQSIKEEIGELSYAKRGAQNQFRQLNKVKRELTDSLLLFDEIERVIQKSGVGNNYIHEPIVLNENETIKTMIACISDLHYGALVEVEGYTYDTTIAKELLNEYGNRLIALSKRENVNRIIVVNLGDLIEGSYMRTQNAYSTERVFSEQINEASDLIINFLTKLSEFVEVEYAGINGNHDRVFLKNDNLYGDGAVSLSNKIIETFVKYSGNKRIAYKQAEPYHHIEDVHGKKFLFVHGDKTALARKTILSEQSTLYNLALDAVIGGHIHHFTMREVGCDKFVATFGSLKGSDEYSLKTIGTSSSRSQGVILVGEDGEYEIKKIKL